MTKDELIILKKNILDFETNLVETVNQLKKTGKLSKQDKTKLKNITTQLKQLKSYYKRTYKILQKKQDSTKSEDYDNPSVSFKLLGYDIVRSISLRNASGKVLDEQILKKGEVNNGAFKLGAGLPLGEYSIQIIGTHYPIVRGKVWWEGKESLNESKSIYKKNQNEWIDVLIDFKQDFAESPWYPDSQDNPSGSSLESYVVTQFGVKEITLRRTNSSKPLKSWSIPPEDFKGNINIALDEENYPDDVYFFELTGYNNNEKKLSVQQEKIDSLSWVLNWETKAENISVKLDIDFDPRWIYFTHENGDEEAVQITGEKPYTSDATFSTSDIITKRLKPGKYKVKVTGVGNEQKNKVKHAPNVFIKSNLYSRFDVLIKISDNDLREERDMNQITSHLIDLATNWWKTAVHLITEEIENRFKNESKPVVGLLGMLDDSFLGNLAEEFGGIPYIIAGACEGAITLVVNQISNYANEQLQIGKSSLEKVLDRVDVYIARAQTKYTITSLDEDDELQNNYLYKHRALTTKKMLLQIEKDIDTLIVGKSMSVFINNIFK